MKIKKEEFYCEGCNEYVNKIEFFEGYNLCSECIEKYDDKTGYCSLNCCLGGDCDQSC